MTKNHIPFGQSIFWTLILVLVLIFSPQKTNKLDNIDTVTDQLNNETSVCESIPFFEESAAKTEESIVLEESSTDAESTVSEEIILKPETSTPPAKIDKKEPKYGFEEEEIYLLTVLLCGSKNRDGDGEYDFDFEYQNNYKQISLVLCVVMNRVESKTFPNTVSEVLWQPRQFSAMKLWKNKLPEVSKKSLEIVRNWCVLYDNFDPSAQTIPKDHLYFSGNNYENISRKDYK